MNSITGVRVKLVGEDGNAFYVLGIAKSEMKRAGVSQQVIDEFMAEAMCGDYDHLLRTVMKYCDVE